MPDETLLTDDISSDDGTQPSDDKPSDGDGTDLDKDGKPGDVESPGPWENGDLEVHESLKVMEDVDLARGILEAAQTGKMSKEQAQAAVNAAGEAVKTLVDAVEAKQTASMEEWVHATKTDTEIGGDRLEGALTNGREALKQFGTSEFAAFIDQSGIGNNVEFLKFMNKIGEALRTKEDSLIRGKDNQPPSNPLAARYPSMFDSEGNSI